MSQPNKLQAPEISVAERSALRALLRGQANPGQQRAAARVILEKFCGLTELAYVPGGPDMARHSDFNGGRQFVGQCIAAAGGLPFYTFRDIEDDNGDQA